MFELIRSEAAKGPQQRKLRLSVQRLCSLLDVSTSGYYDWLARMSEPPQRGFPADERILVKMRAVQEEVNWVYGSRRLCAELVANGEPVGRRRVRRIVRENGLYPIQEKRFRKTRTPTMTSATRQICWSSSSPPTCRMRCGSPT